MRMVHLVFALYMASAFGTGTRADPLSEQLQAVQKEGRTDLAKPAAAHLSLQSSRLGVISDPAVRSRVATDLAIRRGLADVADGNWAAATPNLQSRARSLLASPDVIAGVNKDPLLSLNVAWRIPGARNEDMVGGEFVSRPDGTTSPIVRSPQSPIRPIPLSLLASEPTENTPPDLGKLPFPISFVVELRIGNLHCSGALIRSDVILTARHCILNENGSHMDGSQISVRSTAGGPIVQGRPGPVWTLEAPQGQSSESRYRDVGLLALSSAYPGQITYAQVSPASIQELWVVMAGVGYTDISAPNLAGWNPSYFGRQVVNFGAFSADVPGLASIPWDNTNGDRVSQCAGDSGGPVFVVGRTGIPLIVGVLSRTSNGEPNSIASCTASSGAAFINLGHPFVHDPLCEQLQSVGSACRSPLDDVRRNASG